MSCIAMVACARAGQCSDKHFGERSKLQNSVFGKHFLFWLLNEFFYKYGYSAGAYAPFSLPFSVSL